MHLPEAHLTKRVTQGRDQRRQIGQTIGPRPKQGHRNLAVMQSLLMANAAVDGHQHVEAANHGIEQFAVGQVCPADIHDGRNIDPLK